MAATETIFQLEPPLAVLTFNRPEARNAMTWAMYDALVEACDRVEGDEAVGVLVLRGAGGKAFAAGTDISQFQRFQTPQDGVTYEQHIADVLDRLERVTKPTIAQIEGVAVGAGCAIAVTCDLRVATPESTFGIPIARTLGNCVTGAAFSRLVDLAGPGRTKDMLFTGRLVPAEEAHEVGLVDRLVPAGEIEKAVRELALQIASNAPLTVRATKEMTRRLLAKRRLTSPEARDLIEMCYGSADFREGVAAFLAKRAPKWTGR
ncbi:MAG: enoyl-CoA hydratase [Acidobacteria bacterium RIFCSPLOWO2_02_FULL_68_18]|nr:MAG: enoyl-CoA hydratase [Acidobacteria bacterium RIFCSPLOWO2_02_FULL_68_18]OFW52009.1 MAG: enoyl-CoA hydratase [Acidobacteria bacterium RIFCSPLOWO2_12_FULL_68_19]